MVPMFEPGRRSHLPAPYRITLALSLALFLHSLLGAALALHWPTLDTPEPPRVELTLVTAGSPDTTASDPARAARPTAPARHEPVTVISRSGPEPRQEKQDPAEPDPSPSASTNTAAASPPPPAADTRNQGRASPIAGDEQAQTSQIPRETGSNQPRYEHELAKRISEQVAKDRITLPKASLRERLRPVELEVRLMKNGALVDARITRSSGFAELDRSALQAALRASPYPEPPASRRKDDLRYRVEFHLESAPPG